MVFCTKDLFIFNILINLLVILSADRFHNCSRVRSTHHSSTVVQGKEFDRGQLSLLTSLALVENGCPLSAVRAGRALRRT